MKYPLNPFLDGIYQALLQRKLVKTRSDFVQRFMPQRSRSMVHFRPSGETLLRLYKALLDNGQHDLAAQVHQQMLAMETS